MAGAAVPPCLCIWASAMPGDRVHRSRPGSTGPLIHLRWKQPQVNLGRILLEVLLHTLAHLRTRLFGLLQRFVPAVGKPLSSVPPFPVVRAGAMDLVEGVAFSSLGMVLDSWKGGDEVLDKKPTWKDDAAQDFGGPPDFSMMKGSACLHTVSKDTNFLSEGQLEETTDSEWSDDDDDHESRVEDSELNSELWESFLRSDDPYNPFNFLPAGRNEGDTGTRTDKQTDMLQGFLPVEDERTSQDQKKAVKKVHFSNAVAVHYLVVWQFASRAARDGSCWLEMARDRERFRRRVQAAGNIIGPCLLLQHRVQVWQRIQQDSAARTTASMALKEDFKTFLN